MSMMADERSLPALWSDDVLIEVLIVNDAEQPLPERYQSATPETRLRRFVGNVGIDFALLHSEGKSFWR